MTSYFQDGGHDVILLRKAFSPPRVHDVIVSLYALQ